MDETKHDFQGVLSARDGLCLRQNLTLIGMTMTTKNKFLLVLATSLLLSACGSSDKDKNSASKQDEAAVQSKTEPAVKTVTAKEESNEQEATKLVATPVKAIEELKERKMNDVKDEFTNWQQGRVQFLNLEGGFYGIITDSGKKILPMNLAKEFAQNGAVVRIKGEVKNVLTIQQWGTPFTITEIELVTPGNNVKENEL